MPANSSRMRCRFSSATRSNSSTSTLRAVLYAVMELVNNVDGNEVLAHLSLNIPNYYADKTQRDLGIELADFLAKRLETLRHDEASAARVLRELAKHLRLG